MSKKMSLIGLGLVAALPLAAQAIPSTFTMNLTQGYGASPSLAGGVFVSTYDTIITPLTATFTIDTLPGQANLDPTKQQTMTLNGSWSYKPFALGGQAFPGVDMTWTYSNAVFSLNPVPGTAIAGGFYPGPSGLCPAGGFCVDSEYRTNATGGVDAAGYNLNLPGLAETIGGLAAYQAASAAALIGGTVTCVTGLGAACAAGLTGPIDIVNVNLTANASAGFAVVPGSRVELAWISNSGMSAYGLTGQVVPVPTAVWLFGSAVGLLGVIRRRMVG